MDADWSLLWLMLPFAAFCWWAGYFATKRYKINKHKDNEFLD